MAGSNRVQQSFADGELAPSLYARTDLLRYTRGLRTCRNMIVQKEGGVANRAGTGFIKEAKDSSVACRLIEFVLDATAVTDTYVMEFGQGYIRFYQNGARVVVSSVAAWADTTAYAVGDLVVQTGVNYYCTTAHTSVAATDQPGTGSSWQSKWYALTSDIYEIPTTYATADLPKLVFKQVGNTVRITHQSYPVRDLKRTSSTRWTLTSVTFGPAISAPTNVSASGGTVSALDTYYAVTAVMDGTLEESLAGYYKFALKIPDSTNNIAVSWNNVAGAAYYRVYRGTDGKTYGLVRNAGGVAVARTDATWTDSNEVASGTSATAYTAAAGACQNTLAAISATQRAGDGKYTITFHRRLQSGAASVGRTYGRVGVYYKRNTDAVRVLVAYVDTDSIGGALADSGSVADTVTITVPDDGYATLLVELTPEVKAAGGGSTCTLTIDTAADSVTWTENANAFTDVGTPTPDYAQGPPTQQTLFNAGAYPAAVGEFQQRDFLANTSAEPNKVYGSRTASRNSFARSTPLRADDLLAFTLVSDKAHAVKHLLDLHGLVIFTTAGAFSVGGNAADVLTPDSIRPQQIAQNGIGDLRPLVVGQSAIYLQGRKARVRDLYPVEAAGGLGGYQGTDLSVFSSHLFKGYTIVDWAYAEEPFSVVWLVRSDGALLGLTYDRSFDLWGWHRHDTDGTVENVCVVPEGAEDAVYLVVKRTINGATKRYIERMKTRQFTDIAADAVFMDCAYTVDGRYTGTVTMTLSGGTLWDATESLTLTASGVYSIDAGGGSTLSGFQASDVGNSIYLTGAAGTLVRCTIIAYTSNTVVTVRPDRLVPAPMRAVAIGNGSGSWSRAIVSVTGVTHLEGKSVAVLGDGYVLASPNNYRVNADGTARRAYPLATVTAGVVTLPRAAAVVHVGLPYLSDVETLDIDTAGGASTKHTKKNVSAIGLFLQATRGVWAGRPDKWSSTDPLNGLDELKPRTTEGYDTPPSLVTDYRELTTAGEWNSAGRMFMRQVDPLPMTVLSVSPIGYGT
jgi:hypothetical protein